ncbi:MAG TPA: thiamine phosphate synthase, partial [Chthoniobacterales bacterium]
ARMLDGGVGMLQLRAKQWGEAPIAKLAEKIQPLCARAGVPFILNDFPQLVPVVGADGAHVGQDDLPVAEARALAGGGKIIGKSTHSLAQAEAAWAERPDYIGFGPLFATATKPDYVPIGTEDIAEVHRRMNLPIFCIGGIKLENLRRVVEAGAKRVVIVSGILQAADIPAYCRECLGRLP